MIDYEPEPTHYVPFLQLNLRGEPSRTQTAACGVYIHPREHDEDPTCRECRAFVAAKEEQDQKTADELFGAPGECVTGPPPVKKDFDVLAGYRPKGGR